MDIPSGILLACSLCLLPGFGNSFNIDTKRPQIIAGSRESFFGYTVQQHDIGGKKWLVVGAPYESNGQQKTGDVYKCPVLSDGHGNCTKLNLGRVTLSNVSERKDNMRLGLSLATNPRDSSFLACSPLWSHECGSSYYTTGMCSRVNSNFRFSRTVAPALQSEDRDSRSDHSSNPSSNPGSNPCSNPSSNPGSNPISNPILAAQNKALIDLEFNMLEFGSRDFILEG